MKKILGKPLSEINKDDSLILKYTDVEINFFMYDTDSGAYLCVSMETNDPSVFAKAGISLNKNREEIIKIFGRKPSPSNDEDIFSEGEHWGHDGTYVMEYHLEQGSFKSDQYCPRIFFYMNNPKENANSVKVSVGGD